jgi:hypothetical protein
MIADVIHREIATPRREGDAEKHVGRWIATSISISTSTSTSTSTTRRNQLTYLVPNNTNALRKRKSSARR